jgi:hypothetical protein
MTSIPDVERIRSIRVSTLAMLINIQASMLGNL